MSPTQHAVILVAGEGKRLRPFTLTSNKSLACVNGQTILHNALKSLADQGCEQVRIVTGHLGDQIRERITNRFAGMVIDYVHNPDYANTNSMYSLALGLQDLDKATWVLEGDVFFDSTLLQLPVSKGLTWFVDSATRHLDGAYIAADVNKHAVSLNIVRDLTSLRSNQFKSVGILHLSPQSAVLFQGWLKDAIREGRQNDYYDLILRDRMPTAEIDIVDVVGHRWFEIDNQDDLQKANKLFT